MIDTLPEKKHLLNLQFAWFPYLLTGEQIHRPYILHITILLLLEINFMYESKQSNSLDLMEISLNHSFSQYQRALKDYQD